MRRALVTIGCVVVAVAGVIGLIAWFNGRDSSTTSQSAPAQTTPVDPRLASRPLLKAGNIVVTYGDPADGPRLKALGRRLGAADTPELRSFGAALVVRRRAGTSGIQAVSARHSVTVANPTDPRLQDFIERYLGEGAPG